MATSSMPESESDAAARGSGERQPETGRPTAQCGALGSYRGAAGCRAPGPAGLSEQGPGVPGPLAAFAFA